MSSGIITRASFGKPLRGKEYIPGTEDIIIKKGQYLMGNQVIKGDKNLIPHNIVRGTTIFGVEGNRTPNELMLYTDLDEPEQKTGLWVPCGVEITTIIFSPEYSVEEGEYPEGTLVLPISTYNKFQLSEMMPVVYSSAPYVYHNGELIRYTSAKIGDGEKWVPFDISTPLIKDGVINPSFFTIYNQYAYCPTLQRPLQYSMQSMNESNGVCTMYFNQRSMHNVYLTYVSDTLLDIKKYNRLTIKAKSTVEYDIGGEATNYKSYAGAKIGFKTTASSTVVNNFKAFADILPGTESYELDISFIKEGYLAVQLNAYEYGAITLEISDMILG